MSSLPDPAGSFAPVRHFLGWDRPLLEAVIEHLSTGWTTGVLDLSDRLVVVPTRQSGRRVREALAERAAARGAGVFPPRVLTTEAFITELRGDGRPVATAAEALWAWVAVLEGARLDDYPALFPQPPLRPDFPWALRVAQAWHEVRRTLGESGVSIAQTAALLAEDGHAEAPRWADLARLEALYLRRLADGDREDVQVARRQAAAAPVWPEELKRLDLVAVTDPLDVAVQAAARLGMQGVEVGVLVAAPADRADAFDAWGRPEPDAWNGARDLPLPLSHIHLASGPLEQAERVRSLAAGHIDPAATLGLGVADPEVAAALVATDGEGHGTPASSQFLCHRPEGVAGSGHELWHVLDGLCLLLRERSYRSLGKWLRYPPVAGRLRHRAGLEDLASQAALLSAWDAYACAHLPQSLADGRAFPEPWVNAVTAAAEALIDDFSNEPLSLAVASLLSSLYAGRSFSPATPDGGAFIAMARELSESLRQAEAAAAMVGLTPGSGEMLGFVLEQLRDVRIESQDRPPHAVDLNGWLEILWDGAPHLILAGFNDGRVPEVIVGDPYLPESLRTRLGLRRTNAARLARDAHQLHALLASREATEGRVDVVLGRLSSSGESLRPSRVLFLRPDSELAARAEALFGGDRVPDRPPPPAWREAWRLRVPAPQPFDRISVTALRDYLACPFRFFLRHGRRMEEVDADPRELDARAFGSLCHRALKALTAEPSMRGCTDASVIADFLHDRVRQALRESHGPRLTVPLRVQLLSAEKRLVAFAAWQAQSAREGWETLHSEVSFADLLGGPWILGGLEIRGVIDRVDARGSERRILDYKTTDSPRPVAEAHLGRPLSAARLAEGWPSWQLHHNDAGETFAWRDLQLPLYAIAARQVWGEAPEAGYFHLAKSVEQCAYEPWTDLTPELLDAAEACARSVVEAIVRQEFWPPRKITRHDDFAWMFPGGDAATLFDPAALLPT